MMYLCCRGMYCHKQDAICFTMWIISGKPRNFTSANRHTGKCEPIYGSMETEIGEKCFNEFLVIRQISESFYHYFLPYGIWLDLSEYGYFKSILSV